MEAVRGAEDMPVRLLYQLPLPGVQRAIVQLWAGRM
jgi:hypothetical protein